MWTWVLVLCSVFVFWYPSFSPAQEIPSSGTVSVEATDAGVRVVKDFRSTAKIVLDKDATVAVWLLEVAAGPAGEDTCPTAMTTVGGIRLSRDGDKDSPGWEYVYRDPGGYRGQICAILESGVVPQTLYWSIQ